MSLISEKISDAARIKLPVGDALAVRAPAERVSKIELFFIHPVRRAVDGRCRIRPASAA